MDNRQHKVDGDDRLAKVENKQDDHISRLCDAVIHHIISFLPVKDAARTTVLSKRWRKLWASIPILEFDKKCFLQNIRGALRSDPSRALVDFMSGAILCREQAPINLLRMSLDYNSSFYYPVRQWIQISMKFNVQEMHLDLSGGDFFLQHCGLYASDPLQAYYCVDDDRPRWDYDSVSNSSSDGGDSPPELDSGDESESDNESDSAEESDSASSKSDCSNSDDEYQSSRFIMLPAMFTYGSLRVLQLTRCNITHEGLMVFGNLTCLVLRDVNVSEKLLHKMLSSCCMLEQLELRKIAGLKHLEFSAPKLLSLKLECCHFLKVVTINAQELQHFKFGLSYTTEVISLHFPALAKLEIGLCHNINCNMKQRADRLVKLLKDFSHVKDLTLYSGFFKDMTIPRSLMKNFTMSMVRRFEMIGKMGNDAILAIFGLLKAFNHLESLCLSIVHPNQPQKIEVHHEEKQLRKLERISISCLQSHLKELTIHGFEGNDIEIKLLKFLLDNGKILEKVDIKTFTPSFLAHGEINAKLLNWRRSQDLKLHYK